MLITQPGVIRSKHTSRAPSEESRNLITELLVCLKYGPATLHTNDAAGALPRLTNMGIDPFLTTSAIGCVVVQRLARRLCEGCKEPIA
jgi:hypothetical protein